MVGFLLVLLPKFPNSGASMPSPNMGSRFLRRVPVGRDSHFGDQALNKNPMVWEQFTYWKAIPVTSLSSLAWLYWLAYWGLTLRFPPKKKDQGSNKTKAAFLGTRNRVREECGTSHVGLSHKRAEVPGQVWYSIWLIWSAHECI